MRSAAVVSSRSEVAAAWYAVDLLRHMYAAPDRDTAHRRLVAFYEWAATVEVEEITRLAHTLDTWQDEVLAFFGTRASNGPTESANARIKDRPASSPGLSQHGQLHRPHHAPRRPAT